MLIALLKDIQGELRADIVHHLNDVTGEQLGMNDTSWADWWEENKESFKPVATGPRQEGRNVVAAEAGGGTSLYYGMSLYAQKLVFVIDISAACKAPAWPPPNAS